MKKLAKIVVAAYTVALTAVVAYAHSVPGHCHGSGAFGSECEITCTDAQGAPTCSSGLFKAKCYCQPNS
jgi:hypothetical protein